MTSGGLALAEEQAAPQVKRQHALNLLKRMSERLAHAKAFTFRARSTIESPGAGVMEFGTLAHSVTHSH